MQRVARAEKARLAAAGLGARLGNIRSLRGLSMAQVEALTGKGIERSALSRIENGSRANPSVETLLMICVAYDIDIKLTRKGEIDIHGTRLAQLEEERRRAQLPAEGSK